MSQAVCFKEHDLQCTTQVLRTSTPAQMTAHMHHIGGWRLAARYLRHGDQTAVGCPADRRIQTSDHATIFHATFSMQ